MKTNLVLKYDTCAVWAWHGICVQPGWAQLVWMSYLSPCFVRKLTSCEFAAERSIWPWLSGDHSLAEQELAIAAALLWRQMLQASSRLSGDHHCFLWAPLCLVLWSVSLITDCLPALSTWAAMRLDILLSPLCFPNQQRSTLLNFSSQPFCWKAEVHFNPARYSTFRNIN